MSVVFCGVCPHPPVMVPAVGKKQSDMVIESRRAMLELGKRLKESGAGTMVMITPHGPVFNDVIAINASTVLKGSLKSFGAPGVFSELENDLDLAAEIYLQAGNAGIEVIMMGERDARQYGVNLELDHGITVPLHFLSGAGVDLPAVVVYMGLLSYGQLYSFGMAVKRAAEKSGKGVAVIASGDLSHRLTGDAPAGYDPLGGEFDREMVRLLGSADVAGIMSLPPLLVERAGECGLRPVIMMLGAMDGQSVEADVLSYEGPFGVGYMVASFRPGAEDPDRRFGMDAVEGRRGGQDNKRKEEGFLPAVARAALEQYSRGERFNIPPDRVPDGFKKPAGVFVSLKKKGQLRGCIGTVTPQCRNIVEETARNAISAGHRDQRFQPLREGELEELDISVDVLQSPEPVASKEELDPRRYGVIVRSGRKQGLLLPNLEGVNTVDEQLDIAMQKAGIYPGEPVELKRFEVIRHR